MERSLVLGLSLEGKDVIADSCHPETFFHDGLHNPPRFFDPYEGWVDFENHRAQGFGKVGWMAGPYGFCPFDVRNRLKSGSSNYLSQFR